MTTNIAISEGRAPSFDEIPHTSSQDSNISSKTMESQSSRSKMAMYENVSYGGLTGSLLLTARRVVFKSTDESKMIRWSWKSIKKIQVNKGKIMIKFWSSVYEGKSVTFSLDSVDVLKKLQLDVKRRLKQSRLAAREAEAQAQANKQEKPAEADTNKKETPAEAAPATEDIIDTPPRAKEDQDETLAMTENQEEAEDQSLMDESHSCADIFGDSATGLDTRVSMRLSMLDTGDHVLGEPGFFESMVIDLDEESDAEEPQLDTDLQDEASHEETAIPSGEQMIGPTVQPKEDTIEVLEEEEHVEPKVHSEEEMLSASEEQEDVKNEEEDIGYPILAMNEVLQASRTGKLDSESEEETVTTDLDLSEAGYSSYDDEVLLLGSYDEHSAASLESDDVTDADFDKAMLAFKEADKYIGGEKHETKKRASRVLDVIRGLTRGEQAEIVRPLRRHTTSKLEDSHNRSVPHLVEYYEDALVGGGKRMDLQRRASSVAARRASSFLPCASSDQEFRTVSPVPFVQRKAESDQEVRAESPVPLAKPKAESLIDSGWRHTQQKPVAARRASSFLPSALDQGLRTDERAAKPSVGRRASSFLPVRYHHKGILVQMD